MNELIVPIVRLPGNEDVPLPSYQTTGSAGMDLCAAVERKAVLLPGAVAAIPCGFIMAVPEGYEAQIRPRSGLALKHAISVINAPGTIDSDYRGEVKVLLINLGQEPFEVSRGLRIAQLVISPVQRARWQELGELPATSRGAGGFGHTGTH